MEAVAVIGVGAMGSAFVKRFTSNSVHVVLWNRTISKAETLATSLPSEFVSVAKEPSEVLQTNTLLLALWDAASISAFLDALGDADLSGRYFLCTQTISTDESFAFACRIRSRGAQWVEVPVLGNQFLADQGKIQLLLGGTQEDFTRFESLLSHLGTPRYIGEIGKASTMKLGLNFILGANLAAFSNAYALMENANVDLDMFTTVLTNGPFNMAGGYYGIWANKMHERSYEPAVFPVVGIKKDVSLAVDQMKQLGVNTVAAEAVLTLYTQAEAQGNGTKDFSAVYDSTNPKK